MGKVDARNIAFAIGSRLHRHLEMAAHNPRWIVMDCMSRFASVRRAIQSMKPDPDLSKYDLDAPRFTCHVDPNDCVAALKDEGFCKGLRLRPKATRRILKFAQHALCFGNANPVYGFRYADKATAEMITGETFSLARYLYLDELDPTIDSLARDPLLLKISAMYFGSEPTFSGARLWWTFATPAGDYDESLTTSFFHFDKDDYAAVRFFFYLTPVDDTRGPHVVVRGSHQRKRLSQIVSLGERSDREIREYYGEENFVTIGGAAGSGFGEDPFCFHKATRPREGDRLTLELKFATRDYEVFPLPDRALSARVVPDREEEEVAI